MSRKDDLARRRERQRLLATNDFTSREVHGYAPRFLRAMNALNGIGRPINNKGDTLERMRNQLSKDEKGSE